MKEQTPRQLLRDPEQKPDEALFRSILDPTLFRVTVVWISLWENLVKAGFYFTQKTRPGVLDLPLSPGMKTLFAEAKPVGKLIPLILDIKDETSLPDFITLINHKKTLP